MKRMKWKKFGAAVLTLAMLLSAIPGTALAVDASEQATNTASEVQAQTGYRITVQGGHAECYVPEQGRVEVTSAPAGTRVQLHVDEPEGKVFSRWVVEQGDMALDVFDHGCEFRMPAGDVTIRAEFVPGHKLTVEDERGEAIRVTPDGVVHFDVSSAAAGDQIYLMFYGGWEGMDFSRWVVKQGNVEMENPMLRDNTFTMPDEDVVISPEFKPTGWRQNEVGRWYVDESGSYVTGWQIVDGSWHYFSGNGYVQTGWQYIGGYWYLMDEDGCMLTGWVSDSSGNLYHMDQSGRMQTGWQYINGDWYYFNGLGHAQTGWQNINGSWYYFNVSEYADERGYMLTGWQWIDGKCYYFYDSGAMATNTWIGGSYVDGSGAWVEHPVVTGWQSDSNGWWYNDENGNYVTGWQQIGSFWFYFSGNGYMQTGWQIINGTWYYLDGNGHLMTGWQVIDGAWYYFDGNGHMLTGWQWIDGKCYYFYSSGYMATGTWIGGSYVDASGAWVQNPVATGWQSNSNGWWYNDENGNYVTGWQQINGNWFYFSGNGYMQTGWQAISGAWYYFDSNGHMLTGWQWIDGNCYYFYSSGYMATNTWIGGSYVNGSGVWVQ